jgi:hypothetical protein
VLPTGPGNSSHSSPPLKWLMVLATPRLGSYGWARRGHHRSRAIFDRRTGVNDEMVELIETK